MKFCQRCSKIIVDEAAFCPNCGFAVAYAAATNPSHVHRYSNGTDGLAVASKIFLVLGCIAQCWLILPLAWCLPITIALWSKMNNNYPVSTGLKVCALLFVNTIAGILLLCRDD